MRPGFDPQVRKIPWRRKWQPTLLPGKFHGWRGLVGYSPWALKESDTTEQLQCSLERSRDFPHGSSGKESTCQYRRCPGEGNADLLHYSCLENSVDRRAWQATVHRIAKHLDMTEHALIHQSSNFQGLEGVVLFVQMFKINFISLRIRKGYGNPLQYSCLENSRDRESQRVTVHGVVKSSAQFSSIQSLSPV